MFKTTFRYGIPLPGMGMKGAAFPANLGLDHKELLVPLGGVKRHPTKQQSNGRIGSQYIEIRVSKGFCLNMGIRAPKVGGFALA